MPKKKEKPNKRNVTLCDGCPKRNTCKEICPNLEEELKRVEFTSRKEIPHVALKVPYMKGYEGYEKDSVKEDWLSIRLYREEYFDNGDKREWYRPEEFRNFSAKSVSWKALSQRDGQIVKKRFMTDQGERPTRYREIASKYGISPERVRQIIRGENNNNKAKGSLQTLENFYRYRKLYRKHYMILNQPTRRVLRLYLFSFRKPKVIAEIIGKQKTQTYKLLKDGLDALGQKDRKKP